ncbi:hypothetical protein MBLNU13_g05435t1 [Cladosporium sp. NU13]
MPAPSQLAIATSVLNRLIKEEKSYHKELEQQNVKIAKLEAGEDADNENAEFILRQQKQAVEQTKAVFPALNQKIRDALAKLEEQLEQDKDSASPEEVTKAKEALDAGHTAAKESSL